MRSSKKRSLLIVNEHFESKRNDKVALLDSFCFIPVDRRGGVKIIGRRGDDGTA